MLKLKPGELRRRRLQALMSQQGLAIVAGLSTSAISKIESGHQTSVHPDTLKKLGEALGCSPFDIAELVDDGTEASA